MTYYFHVFGNDRGDLCDQPPADLTDGTCGHGRIYAIGGENGWPDAETHVCRHCQHGIFLVDQTWCAPDAGSDRENGDGIWYDVCPDNHDDVTAPHEPEMPSLIQAALDSGRMMIIPVN